MNESDVYNVTEIKADIRMGMEACDDWTKFQDAARILETKKADLSHLQHLVTICRSYSTLEELARMFVDESIYQTNGFFYIYA